MSICGTGWSTVSEMQLASPPDPLTASIARISVEEETGKARVYFPENLDPFKDVVKRLGYKWQKPYWVQRQTVDDVVLFDRMAELARDLLAAGFRVKADTAVVQAAVSGTFAEAPRRTVCGDGEMFGFWWAFGDDWGDVVATLPGARWSDRHRYITVPGEQYEAVLDFAQTHDFMMLPTAVALVEQVRLEVEGAWIVQVSNERSSAPEPPIVPRVPRPLEEPDTAVPLDLLDD